MQKIWLGSKALLRPSGCIEWAGYRDRNGYGRVWFNGRNWGAHRVAYLQFSGKEPGALFVCHRCDNTSCINPAHLFLGTAKENTRDCLKKGRNAQQKIKHCPQGHLYSKDNTWISLAGHRQCRTCNRDKARARRLSDPKKDYEYQRTYAIKNAKILKQKRKARRSKLPCLKLIHGR